MATERNEILCGYQQCQVVKGRITQRFSRAMSSSSGISSLTTRTGTVLVTLIYSSFDHVTMLTARNNFTAMKGLLHTVYNYVYEGHSKSVV